MVKQITTEEMRALLADCPGMSEPTRHVLLTGQAVFNDGKGNEYRAPLTQVDHGPTHRMVLPVEPFAIEGEVSWN
jgi:hypothetical protein